MGISIEKLLDNVDTAILEERARVQLEEEQRQMDKENNEAAYTSFFQELIRPAIIQFQVKLVSKNYQVRTIFESKNKTTKKERPANIAAITAEMEKNQKMFHARYEITMEKIPLMIEFIGNGNYELEMTITHSNYKPFSQKFSTDLHKQPLSLKAFTEDIAQGLWSIWEDVKKKKTDLNKLLQKEDSNN